MLRRFARQLSVPPSSVGRRLRVASAIIALGLVASGCAANTPGNASSSITASATTSSTAPDPDASRIVSIASDVAKANGDSAPTAIQWVRATRGAIAQLMDFGVPADQRAINEILILVTGSFSATNAKLPPTVTSLPSGRNLEIVVDPSSWATTDFGIGNFDIDLSTLGLAHTA